MGGGEDTKPSSLSGAGCFGLDGTGLRQRPTRGLGKDSVAHLLLLYASIE